MDHQTLATHEAVDLHEIVNFKTLCIAKSKLMQWLLFDQELKDLMQKMCGNPFKTLLNYRRCMSVSHFRPLSLKAAQRQSSIERKVSLFELFRPH